MNDTNVGMLGCQLYSVHVYQYLINTHLRILKPGVFPCVPSAYIDDLLVTPYMDVYPSVWRPLAVPS